MNEVTTSAIEWDEPHIKALLAQPESLLREEPYGSWIKHQGGLKAVHATLRALPLSEKHRKTLTAMLAEPGASMQKYALMLHVSVATYVRYRASLLKTLATVLNAQTTDKPASHSQSPKTGTASKTNLPRQRMPLIGRETELQAVRQLLLNDGAALLTITGLGGIGKTRLTLEVAASLVNDFEHGVYFVSLAAITNPHVVAATIAQTLGLKTVESRPLDEVLKGYLVDRQMLLVLDNFEQVTPAAPLLHDLLTAAPDLKILVTSRAVLHLYGEFEFNVPPLVVPDLANLPPLETLAGSPAVALFVSRAQAVNTTFRLTTENAPIIAELCVRLEGIPLALELAAARIKFFSPAGLLHELSNRLTLLSQQSSDRSPRHQTLRSALAWSYQLLDAGEQTIFMQLGVFAGGCTLEAVEAVCDAASTATLERMASLVDKSMLLHDQQPDGRPRFKMLEIVRDYALEQLEAAGQTTPMRQRHLAYFLDLFEAIEPGPIQPNLPAWMNRLEGEHDNLRAALTWALESHEDEAALRLVGAVWRFWQIHGHVNEGHQWLKAVIAQSAAIKTLPRAKALWGAGWLGMVTGRLDEARDYFQEGVSIARALDEKRYLGLSLHGIGAIARGQGDFKRSQVAFQESLPLLQTAGSTEDVAWTFEHLGVTALEQGDFEPAIAYLSQSLALFQTLQQRWACGEALTFIGHAALQQGHSALAQERYEAALAIYKELDDRPNIALINSYIGATLFGRGDDQAAIGLYKENLILSQDMKEYWGLVWGVERLAEAAEKLNQPQRAARLWGAANAQRHAAGVLWHPGFHSYYKDERFAALKQTLGLHQWTQLWAEGHSLTLDQIVADALEIGE
jgi:predicted ATPase